ncbi:MAG: glycoside hydrolase family 43 protein [Chryseolinea sp.]
MKVVFITMIWWLTFSASLAQTPSARDLTGGPGICVVPGDFADPSVILVNGNYYAAGTSSEWAPHFPLFKSTNLTDWKQIGYVFKTKPSWSSSAFWAPELFYHQGKFFVYYAARRSVDGVSCIGVATSDDPAKGFTDHGILIETGKEAIDPFVFNDDGKLYISWKAYGLDNRPIELLCSTLSKDGLRLTGSTFSLLKDDGRRGLEGQSIFKHDNYYYLLYSVGNCCGASCSYLLNVARSTSMQGKFENFSGNPLLKDDAEWKCPGHGTLVKSKERKWYYLYHAYRKKDNVFTGRQGMLSAVNIKDGWPVFLKPGFKQSKPKENIVDDFDGPISDRWQWDFRHADPKISVKSNQLCFTGAVDTLTNKVGTVITVRPYYGSYEMSVNVKHTNTAFKGLTIYGDVSDAVGIGFNGKNLEVWEVKKNEKKLLKGMAFQHYGDIIDLKISVTDGNKIQFFYRFENDWKIVNTDASFINGDFLPPWDRSPRPGLYYDGNVGDEGCFSNFKLTYSRY